MQTLGITQYQVLLNITSTSKTLESLSQQLSTGKKINTPKSGPADWVSIKKNNSDFNVIKSINETLDSVAKSIRVADTSMDTIGKYIEQMKELLESIIKNYPPFPKGSEERVKFLKSYTSLRYLIDKLTIPPDDRGAMKIMADPSIVPEAGDWNILIGEGGTSKTIHSEEVHTGPSGLDIPELPDNASDEQINDTIKKLEQAKQTLITKHEVLASDASMISEREEFNDGVSKLYQDFADELESADVVGVAVEMKSLEVKQALSFESVSSLTKARSQLLQLWN
jgi:hypothetical protein